VLVVSAVVGFIPRLKPWAFSLNRCKTAEATHRSPAKSSVVSTSPRGVHYRDIRFITASARVEEPIVASGSVGAVGVGRERPSRRDTRTRTAGGPRRRGLRSPSFRSPACSGRRAPIAGHRRAGPSETVRKRPVSVGHKPYVAIRNGAAGTSSLPRGQRGRVVPTVTLGTSAFPGSSDSFPSARLLPRRVGALSAATIGEGLYSP
jgi:hypothetical protein